VGLRPHEKVNKVSKNPADDGSNASLFAPTAREAGTIFEHSPVMEMLLLLAGVTICAAGAFAIISAAFREHVFWGIGCLCIPVASLFFVFLHWEDTRKAFLVQVVGLAMLCYGGHLSPVDLPLEFASIGF
jgi:hypothetical protein